MLMPRRDFSRRAVFRFHADNAILFFFDAMPLRFFVFTPAASRFFQRFC